MLPGLSGDTPARSSSTVFGVYVWNWAKAPGAFPAMPMAARTLAFDRKPGRMPWLTLYATSALG